MKTVGIIGTNGLPGNYGGWDQLVIHLTSNLKDRFNFIVYTSYTSINKNTKDFNGTKLVRIKFKANGVQSVPYDIVSMIHAIRCCDVLFICGTSGCIFLPIIKMFNKKIILNPDGQEWKRDKWIKPVQLFLKLSERIGINNSTYIISDNQIIKEYIRNEYKKESTLIEYGGDQVLKTGLSETTSKKYGITQGKYAFKVCRIVPENNIDIILDAFSKKPNTNLIIVGNFENSKYGKNLKIKYSPFPNLKLLNPIYDQAILDELRSNCGLYIHGHSVGGTNPSLVEAMNLGLCIVAFKVDYNIVTTENKAIYFENEKDLMAIIEMFENNQLNIVAYQNEMERIAKNRYKWSIITDKYAEVFDR